MRAASVCNLRWKGLLMANRMIAAIVLLLPTALATIAGQSTPTAPANPANQTPKPPDMICWGNGPDWSIQFAWWGARYVGINQPDQLFRGRFFWAPEDKSWVWQRTSGVDPIAPPELSAVVRQARCTDSVTRRTFPYSAQVSLPQGDEVTGCCRQLKPGEAAVPPGTPQP